MEQATEVLEAPEVVAPEATEVVAPEVEEPSTPSHRRPVEDPWSGPPPDADFWSGMLLTKRNMDKAAKSLRYSNLVVFK
jgi:hypothetical protein